MWLFTFGLSFLGGFLPVFLLTCAVSNFILCQLSMKHVGKNTLSVLKITNCPVSFAGSLWDDAQGKCSFLRWMEWQL